jgi:hypothetical protein
VRKYVSENKDWYIKFVWFPTYVRLECGKGVWIWWEKVQMKEVITYDGVGYHVRNLDGSDL